MDKYNRIMPVRVAWRCASYRLSHLTPNPITSMRHLFRVQLICRCCAACCRGGFHVKWDSLHNSIMISHDIDLTGLFNEALRYLTSNNKKSVWKEMAKRQNLHDDTGETQNIPILNNLSMDRCSNLVTSQYETIFATTVTNSHIWLWIVVFWVMGSFRLRWLTQETERNAPWPYIAKSIWLQLKYIHTETSQVPSTVEAPDSEPRVW